MEGVMNGGFKSKDELEKSMATAYRMAVTDTHPWWGVITSPDEVKGDTKNHELGTDGKLRAEMHINIEEQPEIVEKLKSGMYSDLSTGYWAEADYEIEPFDHEGKTATYLEKNIVWDHVAILPNGNIVWDHVAILPNGAGACDQNMGCGSYMNEDKEGEPAKEKDTMVEEKPTETNDCAEALAEAEARSNKLHTENAEQIAALTTTISAFIDAQKVKNEIPAAPVVEPEPKPEVNTEASGAPATVPTTGGVKPVETPELNTDAVETPAEKMMIKTLLPDGSQYSGEASPALANYMLHGTTQWNKEEN
jgi:hypothetical protein